MKNPFNLGYYKTNELKKFGLLSIGYDVQIAKTCNIVGIENISIGNNVRIDAFTTIVSSKKEKIIIGSNIHIGAYCYLSGNYGIEMHDFSNLSQSVKLYTNSDDFSGNSMTNSTIPDKYKNISFGNIILKKHVIIGSGSIVMPSVILEEGVAIGALSFVNKSLKEWRIYIGCPVKILKERSRKIIELENEWVNYIKS
jgi:acetyltransferase-like isoleucine patch superfamily enzyme